MNRSLLSRGVLIALAAITVPSAAPDSIRLRYALVPGASYEQIVSTSMQISTSIDGLPPESAAMVQAMMGDMKQEMTMKIVLDVGQRSPDGSLPIHSRVEDANITMTLAGQPLQIPGVSDKIKGLTSKGRMASDGRMVDVEVEGLQEIAGAPAGLEKSLSQNMPGFPDRDLKIGDSFDVPVRMSLPALMMPGGESGDIDSKGVYTLRSLSDAEALFDVRQTVSTGGGSNGTGSSAGARSAGSGSGDLRLQGGGTGIAAFDRKEGYFRSVTIDMNLEVELSGDPGGFPGLGPAAGEGTPPSGAATAGAAPPPAGEGAVRIKMIMKGPSRVTMSRLVPAR